MLIHVKALGNVVEQVIRAQEKILVKDKDGLNLVKKSATPKAALLKLCSLYG